MKVHVLAGSPGLAALLMHALKPDGICLLVMDNAVNSETLPIPELKVTSWKDRKSKGKKKRQRSEWNRSMRK